MAETPTEEAPASQPQSSSNDALSFAKDWVKYLAFMGDKPEIDFSREGNIAAVKEWPGQAAEAAGFLASPIGAGIYEDAVSDSNRVGDMGAAAGFFASPITSRLMTGGETPTEAPVTAGVPAGRIDPGYLAGQETENSLTLGAVMADDKAAWDKAISDAISDTNAVLNDQFGDVIDRLRSDLYDFQRGKTDINSLYASYTDASNKIMSQAVFDAEGLAPTDVVGDVGRSYDNAEGALNEALVRIDTSENPQMAEAMNAELRFFEGSIESALQSDINMQDALHEASSDYAKSVAQAAWSGDIYNAERSRAEIQIQLNAAIAEKEEELARQNDAFSKAQARATADAEEMYGEEWDPDRDTMWSASMESYLEDQGFTTEMIREMSGAFPSLLEENSHIATPEDWYRLVQEQVNMKNLAALQMPDGRTALDLWVMTADAAAQNPDRSLSVGMNQLIKNMDFSSAHGTVQSIFDGMFGAGQYEIPFSQLGDNAASTDDSYYQAMQRLWKWNRDFSDQYDEELEKARG